MVEITIFRGEELTPVAKAKELSIEEGKSQVEESADSTILTSSIDSSCSSDNDEDGNGEEEEDKDGGTVEALEEIPLGPMRTCWGILPSLKARRTYHPLRNIVDNLRPSPHHGPDKPHISLALGDPAVYGNLPCPKQLVDIMAANLHSHQFNSYAPSYGRLDARKALAQHYSLPNNPLTPEDVVITSGASGALEIAISCLVNEGDSILIPRPGFTLYQVIAESIGAEARHYKLDPDKDFEIDLEDLEAHIDHTTRAIVVNNPSNPCGNILSPANLRGLLEIAERYHLPVICDEIYARIIFSGEHVHPLASLTQTVPILTIGGMAKQLSVPGWRVGWILCYDPQGELAEGDISVVQGLKNLSQLVLGANTLAQSTIPFMFPPAGVINSDTLALENYYKDYTASLEANANFLYKHFHSIPGLTMIRPRGTLFTMVRVDVLRFKDILDDADFSRKLLYEENVLVLPGQCFGIRNYVRLVFAPPQEVLDHAIDRIRDFCHRHTREPVN